MFADTTRHPGTKATPQPARNATDTRDAAYADFQSAKDDLGKKQLRYLRELGRVTSEGQPTKAGERVHNLTDMEAAKLLGWERTSVNGRRAELCGGSGSSEQIQKQPLVVKDEKRPCCVTGRTATAWRTAPGLFDLD